MRVLSALLIAVTAVVALGILFIYSGFYNVAATEPHTPFGAWLLNTTMESSVEARADKVQVPDLTRPETAFRGLRRYAQMCEGCHGGPGVEPSELGRGLTPSPPDLSEAAREFSAAELFWITKHGIRMTGMPAWGATHTDDELWPIVAFIRQLPQMSPERYQRLKSETEAGGQGH